MNHNELPQIRLEQVQFELRRVIVGQDRVLERLLVAVLADGHVLLEGVPGLGKTLALETLARILGGTFTRIQFTADLIPSDIVGTRIYRPSQESFDIEPGPVFANIVLADEINRAPAKVQSALLEVMAERHVTIGGRTLQAPNPFLVVATQNPIESEGVYSLPEAQRDRFLMRVPVDYPTPAEEGEIVRRMEHGVPAVSRLLDAGDVVALQAAARDVYVDPVVADYGVRIVLATRDPAAHGVPEIFGQLEYGASPRASIGLVRAGRAMALLRGRTYVLPQDIYDVAYDILNHRLVLSYRALAEGITTDEIVVKVLSTVRAPRLTTVGADGRTAWQLAPGVRPANPTIAVAWEVPGQAPQHPVAQQPSPQWQTAQPQWQPGTPGQQWQPGTPGQQWQPGNPGQQWQPGTPGQQWQPGTPGQQWQPGNPGQQWQPGTPGQQWPPSPQGQPAPGSQPMPAQTQPPQAQPSPSGAAGRDREPAGKPVATYVATAPQPAPPTDGDRAEDDGRDR